MVFCLFVMVRYGTRGNGNKYTHLRRNKFCMQNGVRDAGVRAVTQALCRSEAEVRAFWAQLVQANGGQDPICVVKPNESAGSDGVYKCETLDAALQAFDTVHGKFNGLGQLNDGALCQVTYDMSRSEVGVLFIFLLIYVGISPRQRIRH